MITLWGRNNSTNVKKVRWVLEELDLPYQQIMAGACGVSESLASDIQSPRPYPPHLRTGDGYYC